MSNFNIQTTPAAVQDPFDVSCTETLIEVCSRHRKIMRRPDKTKWAIEFELLRKSGATKEEIRGILKWYVDNFSKDFVPHAFSAAGFRTKFEAIKAARQRDPSPVPVDPAVQSALAGLGLAWPTAALAEYAPQFAQVSVDNYKDFLTRLGTARRDTTVECNRRAELRAGRFSTADGFMPSLLEFLSQIINPDPMDFALGWIEDFCGYTCRHPDPRTINPRRYAWTTDAPRWGRNIGDEIRVWCGEDKWDAVKEMLLGRG